jgi:hypothetical protein
MKKSNVLLLITVIVVPLFCLALAVAAVFVGFGVTSAVRANDALDEAAVEAEILSIAEDYASTGDLETARARLETLNLPNSGQYISFMVDRYIQEGRGPEDMDTQNLFMLADALGSTTPSMVAALATPTPLPTATLPPTATPLPTNTPTLVPPTDTPTSEPEPTDTAEPPTDTPEPTATPGPPTDTPEPTATPEPTKPPVDFVVTEAFLLPNPQYNSCPGWHQIFVTVVDAAGNPIDGVTVEDTFGAAPPHVSGDKGPGKLEYDLWNNGFSLKVANKADGSPATSEVTPKLSSWDEDIPNEWLVEANYCRDINDCVARKSNNQLCRGHYAYQVTFQRTY